LSAINRAIDNYLTKIRCFSRVLSGVNHARWWFYRYQSCRLFLGILRKVAWTYCCTKVLAS